MGVLDLYFQHYSFEQIDQKNFSLDDVTIAPLRHHVHCKPLKGVGMHTYISVIGYCLKDQGEEHFQFCHRNVSLEHMQKGVDEYVKYGVCFCKNKVYLTQQHHGESCNLLQTKVKKKIGSILLSVLLEMLKFGLFYPIAL
jgi:hypothetical protein